MSCPESGGDLGGEGGEYGITLKLVCLLSFMDTTPGTISGELSQHLASNFYIPIMDEVLKIEQS